MKRSRRVLLVCHCVLNANSRIEGLARYEGVHPIVAELRERGYGLVQLPCPEFVFDGLQRPPRALEDYDTPEYRSLCLRLAEDIERDVSAYERDGVHVEAVVGVEGSPSCGVSITNTARGAERTGAVSVRAPGAGVFISVLRERLGPRGVAFVGVDSHEADLGVASVLEALGDPRDKPASPGQP